MLQQVLQSLHSGGGLPLCPFHTSQEHWLALGASFFQRLRL